MTFVDDKSLTWFAELSYPILSWMMPMYMFQYQDAESFSAQTQRHDVGVIFLPLENMRVRARVTLLDNERKDEEAELQVFMAF